MKHLYLILLCFICLHGIKAQDTTRHYFKTPNPKAFEQVIAASKGGADNSIQHFPYPIIFVHGLISSGQTWSDFKEYATLNGWSFGGEMPYCLECDDNPSYSNINSLSTTDLCEFLGTLPLTAGDFYIMNFNVEPDGESYGTYHFNSCKSNQAAVVKQAAAVGHAIEAVLQLTGKDKVILLGHSMGGLAIRAYLQDAANWQLDGKHHVAKAITTGTPHGGSNVSSANIAGAIADERSDGVRDLRHQYYVSEAKGVLLFGGIEDLDVMEDSYQSYFYNPDVNCDGFSGQYFEGLNQKAPVTDLDYACIIGGTDWVVSTESANLKTYYPDLHCENFVPDDGHLALTGDTHFNFLALDEPDDYYLAYNIQKNAVYNGYFSVQGAGANYPQDDWDDYKFTMPQAGYVRALAGTLPASNTGLYIVRATDESRVAEIESNGSNEISTPWTYLPIGQYYVEVVTTPGNWTWEYPYYFQLQTSSPSATTAPDFITALTVSPNPTTDIATLEATFTDRLSGTIMLSDATGRLIEKQIFDGSDIRQSFSLSGQPAGLYFITLYTAAGTQTWSVAKQ